MISIQLTKKLRHSGENRNLQTYFIIVMVLIVALFGINKSHAIDTFEVPKDPVLAKRYLSLAEELRCLVCQNQNLADSNAELATDLKVAVVEQIIAGRSDDEIRSYMTQRYGDFVVYRPPLDSGTLALWLTPLLVLVISGIFLLRQYFRKTPEAVEPEASIDLDSLLAGDNNDE